MRVKIEKFVKWIKEPSTAKAILIGAGLVGVAITPEQVENIVFVALSLYALISAFWDEN